MNFKKITKKMLSVLLCITLLTPLTSRKTNAVFFTVAGVKVACAAATALAASGYVLYTIVFSGTKVVSARSDVKAKLKETEEEIATLQIKAQRLKQCYDLMILIDDTEKV